MADKDVVFRSGYGRLDVSMTFLVLLAALLPCSTPSAACQAGYGAWKHSGSIVLDTTRNGAALPPLTVLNGFPALVRLNSDFFDFQGAEPHGEDVRFTTITGAALPYQIVAWNPVIGQAAIWVRIPEIRGDTRQTIRLYWGNPGARSESSGAAVFSATNGYLSVLHLGESLRDSVETLTPTNAGTTATVGPVGPARHFSTGEGVSCGETAPSYPTGDAPHTLEAWIRPDEVNGTVLGWGNEEPQGKEVMLYRSPPHLQLDGYFSGADVTGSIRIPRNQWTLVVHTYQKHDSRLYVNGALDGESRARSAPLNIRKPARMWIGGWNDGYDFAGDIAEVRVSSVVRSPDWVRLEYENQNPMQRFVGNLVMPGTAFGVSRPEITVMEGQNAVITAQAGGASQVTWVLKRGSAEKVVAVDRLRYTLRAGRVNGTTHEALQFQAVLPDGVKERTIPVTIVENIPDPIFTLTAPARWNGRSTIELTPHVTNRYALQAKGAGDITMNWKTGPFAVIKRAVPGRLTLKGAQDSGTLTVTAVLSNGGRPATRTVRISVTEPATDPWVARTPANNEKPENGQFYARDNRDEGTLFYNGSLNEHVDSVFLRLYADGRLVTVAQTRISPKNAYKLTVKLKPGLIRYRVEFGVRNGRTETVRRTVSDIVCGDAYLIDGQSNALATDTSEKSPAVTSEWIRSYGQPPSSPADTRGNLWCRPVWKAENGETAELGWWGMELAKRLVESHRIPIFIINAAVGGTRIDQHQRNPDEPMDLSTLYGRMLWRVRHAKLAHGIRAILWHQGENDQGADGPSGRYGWETYQKLFMEMAAGWRQDFPNARHYYLFQIWPDACAMGGKNGSGDMLREKQRTLTGLFSNLSIMSTLGVHPAGGCHFPLAGWSEFATLIQPLIERDNYGVVFHHPITPPNLEGAAFVNRRMDTVVLKFDQPVLWSDRLVNQFYLDGIGSQVLSGSVDGDRLILRLKAPSTARTITYLKETDWSQNTLLAGKNGIAALTFCDVPIERPATRQ